MAAAAVFSSRCATVEVPGIGTITGERCSSQASATCDARGVVCGRDLLQRRVVDVVGHRAPRDEADAVLRAVVEERLGGAVAEAEPVLHRHDVRHLLGRLQLLDGDLGEADVPDLALVLQVLELADLVLHGDVGVDAVQLEQVDPVDLELAQAQLGLLAEVRRPPDRDPAVRPLPGQPGLGGDHQVVGVRVQRLRDELLGDVGAVGVGGVDEGDAELAGSPEQPDRLVVVLGRTPDAGPGDPHRAEAQPDDVQVTAEPERAGGGRDIVESCGVHRWGNLPRSGVYSARLPQPAAVRRVRRR